MANAKELDKIQVYYANERTFLSYIRTSASVLVLAVGLLRFFDDVATRYLGWGTLVAGIAILALGIYRYRQERHRIKHEKIVE